MSIVPPDRDLIRKLYQQLNQKPLDSQANNPLYEPIFESFGGGTTDPVRTLENAILFSDSESLHFFSGFRGSGKTTQLYRLRARLQKQGYIVLYGNAMDYLPESEPVEVAHFLMALAGAFGEALSAAGIDFVGVSYWERLKQFLLSEIELREVAFKAEVTPEIKDIGASVKAGADIKLALKLNPSFRQKLQAFLANRLSALRDQVRAFVKEGYDQLRKESPAAPVVFLFDQMERIRGPRGNEGTVLSSVETIFTSYQELIQLPNIHVVCTAPPWLKLSLPRLNMEVLPAVRLWSSNTERSPYEAGYDVLRGLVHRRFRVQGHPDADLNLKRVFGEPDASGHHPLLDGLIRESGGHISDLLHLIQRLLIQAESFPVTSAVVEQTITAVREEFLPISVSDARILERIGRERALDHLDVSAATVTQISLLLDDHLVLYLINGKPWYDIHPLVRDEVAAVVSRNSVVRGTTT